MNGTSMQEQAQQVTEKLTADEKGRPYKKRTDPVSFVGYVLDEAVTGDKIVGNVGLFEKLAKAIQVPEGWKVMGTHVTTHVGHAIDQTELDRKGEKRSFWVIGVGKDETGTVIAARLASQDGTHNHITLAVDEANGGRPRLAKTITNWEDLAEEDQFEVIGTFAEVSIGGKLM